MNRNNSSRLSADGIAVRTLANWPCGENGRLPSERFSAPFIRLLPLPRRQGIRRELPFLASLARLRAGLSSKGDMPHTPHAEFDQHLLEMIESSPIGAAPSTPAHQESINRLRTSHQIYSDADHKNGYVTARSLSTRPSFFAQNLVSCH